jgi:2-keto-3-deoxy-6-phosphogluconate aldolase
VEVSKKSNCEVIKMTKIVKRIIAYLLIIAVTVATINFTAFLEIVAKAGAKGVGTGISILKPELIEAEDYAKITHLTKLHLEKIKEARS